MWRLCGSVLAKGMMSLRSATQSLEPCSREAVQELLQETERDQRQRERDVDSREVVFSSGASADHRPRIAAAEAFDIAAAALPRPPNFCYLNISVDYAAMLDAPEVVWFNLCRSNDVSPSSVRPQMLHMLGGVVCHQRLGGGYIQVVLGCIPDLETDTFTLDMLPEEAELHGAQTRAPPLACIALLDTRLSLQHEQLLSSNLDTLQKRLGTNCPLVGSLYPSIDAEDKSEAEAQGMNDSIFFISDRVYRGSAAAVILRSKLLRAHAVSVVPSICVGNAVVDAAEHHNGVCTIKSMNGKAATEVVKEVYLLEELRGKMCKVFLGVRSGDARIPISFRGDPVSGSIQCVIPRGVPDLVAGAHVDFLVDDPELDGETAAGELVRLQRAMQHISVEKDIAVARESRRNVVASTTAALHFSHPGLNVCAQPEIPTISLGQSNRMFAPTILHRCVGSTYPNGGGFFPGQVATVGGITGIFARSSTYCFLEGVS